LVFQAVESRMVFDPRSKKAKIADKAKLAPIVEDEEKWAKNRDELDLRGHDTPDNSGLLGTLKARKEEKGVRLFGKTGSKPKDSRSEAELVNEEFDDFRQAEERAEKLFDETGKDNLKNQLTLVDEEDELLDAELF